MGDRILKFCLTWGLMAGCLFGLGVAAGCYFAFTSVVLEVLYAKLLRRDLERRFAGADVTEMEVDRRMLPTDRSVAIGRAALSLLVAVLFYKFA